VRFGYFGSGPKRVTSLTLMDWIESEPSSIILPRTRKGSGMATPVQQRLVNLAADIATTPDELAFQHSVLTQTSLPTSKPPDGLLVWEQVQGRARLRVEAGSVLDPATGEYVQPGLPYGPKARMLLMHLNSEAVRRQSPIIPVEDSMTAFFRRLMGKTMDGREVKRLKFPRPANIAVWNP
jgi:hypothetical protein